MLGRAATLRGAPTAPSYRPAGDLQLQEPGHPRRRATDSSRLFWAGDPGHTRPREPESLAPQRFDRGSHTTVNCHDDPPAPRGLPRLTTARHEPHGRAA